MVNKSSMRKGSINSGGGGSMKNVLDAEGLRLHLDCVKNVRGNC